MPMTLNRSSKRMLTAPLALGAACISNGCRPSPTVQPPANVEQITRNQPAPTATPVPAPADAGTITGTILFQGKPPVGTIDTSMDPACAMGGGKTLIPVEQYAVRNGKLANVFVYVKSGPPQAMQTRPSPAQPVVMDQKGCLYLPHVVGVAAGGIVEFRNSDLTMHNVHSNPTDPGNQPIDISEGPRGTPQRKQFSNPELMIPVRCNNHPWMSAFVNVSATPFFAVTDAAGHFDLHGLPPGNYVLGAVHEKLGEKTLQLTVPPHASAKAEFSFAL
jgi:plastocyanin